MKRSLLVILMSLLLIGSVAAMGGSESSASAQSGEWTPSEDITIIVPYEAGGNTDIPTRIFAKYMEKYADVGITITNIEGAGGRTGANEAMRSDPDGFTYLLQSSGFIMQYALGLADFNYEDFEPVGYFLDSSMAMVVAADSPYQTLDDFIEAARQNPGQLKVGSVSGTLPLFGVLYLEEQNDVTFNKVDLGVGAKAPEVMSHRIESYIDGFGAVKQFIDSGDFRCLAIFGETPVPGYEDIPTLGQLGYEDYGYLKQNFGFWAPKGTPAKAVEYFNSLIKQATADPECIEELSVLAYLPMYTTPEEYNELLKTAYADFDTAAQGLVK